MVDNTVNRLFSLSRNKKKIQSNLFNEISQKLGMLHRFVQYIVSELFVAALHATL